MGQYYYPVNLDKKQYIHPHKFQDGLKLMEFGCSMDGTLTGLTILLANGNGRGGGDLHSKNPIIGTWAGDRIVITGDYADPDVFVKTSTLNDPQRNLYFKAHEEYKDISEKVIEAMMDDSYIKASWKAASSPES